MRYLFKYGGGIGILAIERGSSTCAAGLGLHVVEGTTREQANGSGASNTIDYTGQESELFRRERCGTVVDLGARLPPVNRERPFKA